MTNTSPAHDILDTLYLLKKRNLMAENIYGILFVREEFDKFKKLHDIPKNLSELSERINDFLTIIEKSIPIDKKEEWDYADYEVYTDENHHRKFWNEIQNDNSVHYFLKKFFEFINVAIEDDDDLKFILCLYDFNDFEVYFHNETEAIEFIDKYASAPISAFSKDESGEYWVEEWTI